MEAPVKKRRGRPRNVDQAAYSPSTAAHSRTIAGSNSPIASNGAILATQCLGADTSSHPYQYATEIDTNNENVTANDGLDDLFEPVDGDPDLDTLFEESCPEEFMKKLLDYTQAPNPTQANDDEWNKIMDTSLESAHTRMPEAQVSADYPLPTVDRSPTVLTTGTANRATTPATAHFSATPETSPATSYPTSHTTGTLKKPCSPPSLKVPKPSLFSGLHPHSAGNGEEAADLKFSDSESTGSARDFPEPQDIQKKAPRQKTPARQPLGSPFALSTAPARKATHAMMDMFNSPVPAGNGRIPMPNIPMSSPILRGQNAIFPGSMQNMTDPRFRSSSVRFSSPPNPNTFATNLHNNNLLQSEPNMPQRLPAKRMRVNPLSAQEAMADAHHEQHFRQQIYMQNQLRSGTINPQMVSHGHSDDVQNWIDTSTDGTPAPETMMTRGNVYDYPVPLPSGSLDGVKQELDDNLNVGQKRTASQMMQAGMYTGSIPNAPGFVGQGFNANGDNFAGLYIPQNQLQYAMAMQRRAQVIQHMHMQAAMGLRSGSQSPSPNQFSSPTNMQTPDQSQVRGQQQHQMMVMQALQALQAQRQRQASGPSPGQQMRNGQQQQVRRTPQNTLPNPISTPEQMVRSSPPTASAEPQGTPTPAPRRRMTVSKPNSNMLSSSPPVSSPSVSKVRKPPNNQGVQNRNSYVNTPQRRTSSANAQASSAQRMKTPGNTAEQAQAFFAQAPVETPENHTPAALRAHLPTPQKPISTGACPNTVNETLEETHRRTSAQLRGIPVPMMNPDFDGDLRMNDENMLNGYPAFEMPNDTSYTGSGLPFENVDFTEMMGADMDVGTGFNVDLNGYTTENPNMNAFQNMGPPANMHVDMRQANPSMNTNGTVNTSNDPLDHSLLNSNIRDSSVGYAETILSETLCHTPTPVNNMTASAGGPLMNNAANQPALSSHLENDTPSSQAAVVGSEAFPAVTDGCVDPDDQLLAEWVNSFDESAEFNPEDWGV